MKYSIGDWVFIIGHRTINNEKFLESFGKRGLFGKIVDITKSYHTKIGRRLPTIYTVRVYRKKDKWHCKTTKEYLIKYN